MIEQASFINSIFNDDCLNIMPRLPEKCVNFILTDPPYVVKYKSRDGHRIINDDNDAWLQPAYTEMYRILEDNSFAVSFYGWQNADKFLIAFRKAGFRVIGHFTFPKRYASYTNFLRYQHENAYLLAKGYPKKPINPIGDVIDWTYSGNKFHPTQKPISALVPLVETFSHPDDIVFDGFAGSGSSLVAAKSLNRFYVGIEIDYKYHTIANRRLA
jgi:site-specific DNA-methyltransferase (adenine-specific)